MFTSGLYRLLSERHLLTESLPERVRVSLLVLFLFLDVLLEEERVQVVGRLRLRRRRQGLTVVHRHRFVFTGRDSYVLQSLCGRRRWQGGWGRGSLGGRDGLRLCGGRP